MFDTALKKKRVIGIVLLAVILGLFLAFNRIPKLDTVQADLAAVNAPRTECFQGFCIDREPETGFFQRWWDFSLSYLRLVSLGMTFAFLAAGITEVFLFPRDEGSRFTGGGLKGVLRGFAVGSSMNLCSACIVPIASAFRRRGAPVETAIAITQGSSTLNIPALVMAALVFTPMLASTRIAVSIVGVLLLGPLVALLIRRRVPIADIFRYETAGAESGPNTWRDTLTTGLKDWIKASLRYLWRLGPAMALAGFAGGLVIQWLTPDTVAAYLGNNVSGIVVAATFGILINVPLLFEIPLVAALLLVGMGSAPAAALLFGAAAGGPFTFWGLARVMPGKAVAAFAAGTWSLSVIGGVGFLFISPFFLNDGDSRIVFRSDRDGDFEIYSMKADGSDLRKLTNNTAYDDFPVWSPDGKKIAFVSDRDGPTEINVMNADGSRLRRLTQDNGPVNAFPAWSPDGKKIAFSSDRDGNREIYVMDANGSNQVNLTNDPGYDASPAWSPDGKRILFNTRRDGNLELYVMNADGSRQTRVTKNYTADEFPAWSPDGSKILFSSNRTGQRAIYVMDADGSNPVQLTANSYKDYWPSWSPDGSRIAFASNRYGNEEIMVMNADGSHQTNLSASPAADVGPAWGPGQLPPAASGGPQILALAPPHAATPGDSLVTITGAGFVEDSRVAIGGVAAQVVEFLDSHTLTIAAPPHPAGVADLVVTNPDGHSSTVAGGFSYHRPYFTDVSAAAGVAFQHYRDPTDRIPLGAGVVVFDYNGDGRPDIFVARTEDTSDVVSDTDVNNALYRNNGDGTFTDVAAAAGVGDLEGKTNGGCAADYDNDGDRDLFVTNWGNSKLFRNNGPGAFPDPLFSDVTDPAGLGDPDASYRSMGCAWGDYDRDGFLDFVVVRHLAEDDPEAFDLRFYAYAVRPLALYHNNGDGTFTEVTHLLGDATAPSGSQGEYGNLWGAGFQPAWVDFDNDGDPDLYVINDFGKDIQPNVLWRNDGPGADGAWRFEDISQPSGADAAMFGMGLAVGDYDRDGDFDLYVTNIEDNALLRNNGAQAPDQSRDFTETAADAGAGKGMFQRQQRVSWGTVFFDYDNDGWEDLYVASGHLDSDPFTNHRKQPNLLLRNTGQATFADVSSVSGADDPGVGRGVAYADFDGDGCLDLYVANLGLAGGGPQSAKLFRNSCAWGQNWLTVKTVGTVSNRDGIGARITVTAGDRAQIREIAAGSSNKSQNMLPAHFGLGAADRVDAVEIRWPSGAVQRLANVSANQQLTVTEPRQVTGTR